MLEDVFTQICLLPFKLDLIFVKQSTAHGDVITHIGKNACLILQPQIISFLKIAMVALMILALVQTQENAHPSLLRALHIWLESFCLQMSFKLKYSWFCVTRQYFHKSPHIEDHTQFCLFVQSWSAYNWVDAATWPRGSGESWRSGPLSKSGISLLLYFSMYLYLWFISIFVFVNLFLCL